MGAKASELDRLTSRVAELEILLRNAVLLHDGDIGLGLTLSDQAAVNFRLDRDPTEQEVRVTEEIEVWDTARRAVMAPAYCAKMERRWRTSTGKPRRR